MRYWRQYLVTYGIKDYEKETSTPPTLKWSMAPFVLPHVIRACAARAASRQRCGHRNVTLYGTAEHALGRHQSAGRRTYRQLTCTGVSRPSCRSMPAQLRSFLSRPQQLLLLRLFLLVDGVQVISDVSGSDLSSSSASQLFRLRSTSRSDCEVLR